MVTAKGIVRENGATATAGGRVFVSLLNTKVPKHKA